ncbi:hypothetical protein Acr_10g0001710 [Actinidia rufa]|uniref:Uncharacterized protein n=1 Tax=Actinidia rufa TaxID=165716 RepID=A0A7J0F8Q7_9ERIC|nr:hypothetical protein Acr_10g0001710 [Actinidia rufa]
MSMERYLGDIGDIIGKIAIWRVSRDCWFRGGENLAMGVKIGICWRLIEWSLMGVKIGIRWRLIEWNLMGVKYFTSPKGEEETTLWLWVSLMEIAWRGSMLIVGLVLPRSRGFGDKHPLGRLWATSSVMIRLPDEGETITSTRQGEVAFYEAAFPAGLRFSLHNTIRLILQFYNTCPAHLVPNAWKSIACSMALWRVYKYSISLSEFRNLFSLNCNPKPDQGWLYFKARNKKVLLGGYPSNVKGWKSKFFFVSGDEWEILEGTSRVGAPRVPRTWGIPDKHYNNPLDFTATNLKFLKRFFGLRGRRATIFRAENFRAPRATWVSPKIPMNKLGEKALPETIQSRGKVLDPILDRFSNAPSSNSLSESCSDSSLPVELESDAMLKRVSFKKIGEKLGKAGGAEGKKKATSSGKAPTPPATASPRPGEGSLANLGTVLGPAASMLGSPSVAEKLLRGVIPPADKEKVEKLTLDQTAIKLFHVIGQVAADLEQQLAESRAREQQANDELAKAKSDRDSLSDKFERSGVLVNELREALNKSKDFAVEEFKSSSEFMMAVEDSAFKYFGEGFNFCNVQLR